MNILFDHQIFVSQAYGGVSRLFYELIRHLALKKEVQLLLFPGIHYNQYPLEELKNQEDVIFYWGKRIAAKKPFPHANELLKPLNRLIFNSIFKGKDSKQIAKKQIDIYHPTGYASPVHNWRKSPVVLTIYDLIPELFPDYFPDIKRRLENRRKSLARADRIVVISRNTKQDLMDYYRIDEKKITVTYPGAPFEIIPKETAEPYRHHKPYILYVGTRKQVYKNFENLLVAYSVSKSIVNDYDLICCGGVPFTREERDVMSAFNTLDYIYHETGNDSLLSRLYAGASALIYPSLYEGFGLPPLEAMAHHCPVIASNIPVMTEVLGDAPAYFDPFDTEELAATLERVLSDSSFRNQLIEKGNKQVAKYSWSKMADETLNVYASL